MYRDSVGQWKCNGVWENLPLKETCHGNSPHLDHASSWSFWLQIQILAGVIQKWLWTFVWAGTYWSLALVSPCDSPSHSGCMWFWMRVPEATELHPNSICLCGIAQLNTRLRTEHLRAQRLRQVFLQRRKEGMHFWHLLENVQNPLIFRVYLQKDGQNEWKYRLKYVLYIIYIIFSLYVNIPTG